MEIPFDIQEAMVQCFGRCFWYKNTVAGFMASAGVPKQLIKDHRDAAKFVMARQILDALDETDAGRLIQRKLLTQLCRMRSLPNPEGVNVDEAYQALRHLKQLAVDHDLFAEREHEDESSRVARAHAQQREARAKLDKLGTLHSRFVAAVKSSDRQKAGYSLESILGELCELYGLKYTPSFRTGTERIDGHVKFEGFDYLIEARWRIGQPTVQDIGGFREKVSSKLESTRGIFVSIAGFRDAVTKHFGGRGCNIILFDGEDVASLLEGLVDLPTALRYKTDSAARLGVALAKLRDMSS